MLAYPISVSSGLGSGVTQAFGMIWSWITRWLAGMAWWQWGALPLGVVLVIAGLWWLARGREGMRGVSVPTALAAGFAQVVFGFHLIAWTFPPGTSGAFVGVQWWWGVMLGCAGLVVLSLLVDKLGWDVQPPKRD